jgi:hypothetical protein
LLDRYDANKEKAVPGFESWFCRAVFADEPVEYLHLDKTLKLVLATPSKVETWYFLPICR